MPQSPQSGRRPGLVGYSGSANGPAASARLLQRSACKRIREPDRNSSPSISQQFPQSFTRRLLPRAGFLLSGPDASYEVKVFAEIGHVLLRDGVRPFVAALLCHFYVVTHTVQAHFQIL